MSKLQGCGLGLRREFIQEVIPQGFKPDFWEITPENWIHMPYHHKEAFEEIVSSSKTIAHGVSLSIGSDKKPSKKFLKQMKDFLDCYHIKEYSEHISFSNMQNAHSYELLPLPLTKSMIERLCDRIKYVQDALQRELILENATYYYVPHATMSEIDFLNELIHKSGVKFLLDVNNVYVNSVNHNYDAKAFIDEFDMSTVSYIHIAGHYDDKESGFLVDTHGKAVKDEVWDLLEHTLKKRKVPTMIERDNHIPSLKAMKREYEKLSSLYGSIS
ncbi:DUF692 domain-containing protein [Candidatus Marinarcus aquaticus]|uniref:Uncharacterized protein n=1 Tax=Candidatus Marinarcus aquaticus TaxID=2044504 RepID=A0A4Q0XRT8_9BACT|nr:DUF692 domain-containing protein [Candidatus Marinarcus aquaticus]RXJ58005.1 hypothetical protein CRV04_05730 [Candidatus Marinarcus aquaticus]